MKSLQLRTVASILSLGLFTGLSSAQALFHGMGANFICSGMDASGFVAAGTYNAGAFGLGGQLAYWTPWSGPVPSGTFGFAASGLGISPDGGTLLGTSQTVADPQQAVFVVPPSVSLLGIPGTAHGTAWDASIGASVIVGSRPFGSSTVASILDGVTNPVLGTLPGGTGSVAYAVSYDGSAVTGYSGSSDGVRAFHWTRATGMTAIAPLPGHTRSEGYDISGDGTTIVGGSSVGSDSNSARAFRWTASSGTQAFSAIPAGIGSSALGCNYNGRYVVGSVRSAGVQSAFWYDTLTDEYRHVQSYLTSLGLDLTGWQLSTAEAVSEDGTVMCGRGIHNGTSEGWWVKIEPFATHTCADAQLIQPGFYTGSTLGAPVDSTPNCTPFASRAVWYAFRPTSVGRLELILCGSNFDTVVSVYSSCDGSPSSMINCVDDSGANSPCPGALASYAVQYLLPYQTYYIRIGGYGNSAGEYHLIALFSQTGCRADINLDNNVDPDDLGDFITCYFGVVNGTAPCAAADFNLDGNADPDDLADFITLYFTVTDGQPCP